jgi:hypothetical protein
MMTLQEQLEELRTNILRDVSDIISGQTDSLWSDETLLRYIQDAENRFARRTMILRDSTTPAVTQVRLKAGTRSYELHESVLGVLSASYDGITDLLHSGHAIVTRSQPTEYLSFNPLHPYALTPGVPIAFYTDETLVYDRGAAVVLSVYPEPAADQDGKILQIRTIRKPLNCYGKKDMARASELTDYELDVLEWAAYRAQRNNDADAGNVTSAEAHKAAFEAAIAQALREMKRKMFANIGYKYGGNGFSWVR